MCSYFNSSQIKHQNVDSSCPFLTLCVRSWFGSITQQKMGPHFSHFPDQRILMLYVIVNCKMSNGVVWGPQSGLLRENSSMRTIIVWTISIPMSLPDHFLCLPKQKSSSADTVTCNLEAKISHYANSGSVMTQAAAIHLCNDAATAAPNTHTHARWWHHVMVQCAYMTDYTGTFTETHTQTHSPSQTHTTDYSLICTGSKCVHEWLHTHACLTPIMHILYFLTHNVFK